MYEYLISEYVKNINLDDIINFGLTKEINISIEDAKVLHHYIINNYKQLISDNPTNIIKEIKRKIDSNTFEKVYKVYLEYRNKYLY